MVRSFEGRKFRAGLVGWVFVPGYDVTVSFHLTRGCLKSTEMGLLEGGRGVACKKKGVVHARASR